MKLAELLLLILALTLISCQVSNYGYSGSLYITSVALEDTVYLPKPIIFEVKGAMPDPGWHFTHFKKLIKGYLIEITPIGFREEGYFPQVLVSYEGRDSIKVSKPGIYQITFYGRVQTVVETVYVK